jgi:hypothetical protein
MPSAPEASTTGRRLCADDLIVADGSIADKFFLKDAPSFATDSIAVWSYFHVNCYNWSGMDLIRFALLGRPGDPLGGESEGGR